LKPNEFSKTPHQFTVDITESRVSVRLADVNLSAKTTAVNAGQLQLLGGKTGNTFYKLTMTGTLDPAWARRFFAD
jgi:hypothetical protein